MKIKITITAIVVIIVLVGIISYNSKYSNISAKDHINVSIGPEPSTIDPGKNIDAYGAIYIQHMFEGLVKLDNKDRLVPGMAEKWDISNDGLIYTFYLKNDIKWSDGKEVTADDFAYAWKRVLAPKRVVLKTYI